MNKTQEALRMAIEAIEFKGVRDSEDYWLMMNKVRTACKQALAELSLQEMEENAKELGLGYCKHGSDSACKECYMEQTK